MVGLVLPALAGMSLGTIADEDAYGCAPRASGDEPEKIVAGQKGKGCSPR